VRAPWTAFPDGALPPIPDALLTAVAAPRHAPLPLALRFLCEGADAAPVPFMNSPLLAQCSYLTDMVDVVGLSASMAALSTSAANAAAAADDDDAHALPLPVVPLPPQFARADVDDLMRVAGGRDPDVARYPGAMPAFVRSAEAYEERIAALVSLADSLGAPQRALAASSWKKRQKWWHPPPVGRLRRRFSAAFGGCQRLRQRRGAAATHQI
jgi:hypothetical protein